MSGKTDGMKRYTFHFVGTPDKFSATMSDANSERLFGDSASPIGFATFWGEPTVTVNMQNVTYVEVER